MSDDKPLRDLLAENNLRANKALGQHFLLDLNLTRKIVREAGDLSGLTVIEIGPGPGGLTRALLESDAKSVLAIEKDTRFIQALQPLVEQSAGRLRIIEADALEIDPIELTPAPRAIIANLPYNIGSVLLAHWLQRADEYAQFVLMFQKEVADRIAAPIGEKAYGRLSVLAQYCADVETLFTIPARAFTPPPKIDSAVIRITPRQTPLPVPLPLIENVTAKAFGQRRKMLRGIFKNELTENDFLKLGIRPDARPETLSPAEFAKLALHLAPPSAK